MKKKGVFSLLGILINIPCIGYAAEIESYIVGGNPVRQGDEITWMASIRNTTDNTSHFCGGSIVNEKWVLTAAHCVVQGIAGDEFTLPPNNLAVMVGNLSNEVYNPADLYQVTHVVVHPEYSPNAETKITVDENQNQTQEVVKLALDNDVALLRVNRSFPFPRVNPIKLADQEIAQRLEASLASEWNEINRPANTVVSGWGATNSDGTGLSTKLMYTELSYLPIADCFNLLERGNDEHFIIDSPLNLTKVCALPPDILFDEEGDPLGYGPDACKGDSGGPLVTKDIDGRWVQLGVVSGGPQGAPLCGAYLRPGFYARAGTYFDWIKEIVGKIPDSPISNPDFMEDKETGTSKDDDQDVDTGEGKADEGCNPEVSGISPNNCALNSDGGGGMVSYFGLGGLILMLLRRRVLSRD